MIIMRDNFSRATRDRLPPIEPRTRYRRFFKASVYHGYRFTGLFTQIAGRPTWQSEPGLALRKLRPRGQRVKILIAPRKSNKLNNKIAAARTLVSLLSFLSFLPFLSFSLASISRREALKRGNKFKLNLWHAQALSLSLSLSRARATGRSRNLRIAELFTVPVFLSICLFISDMKNWSAMMIDGRMTRDEEKGPDDATTRAGFWQAIIVYRVYSSYVTLRYRPVINPRRCESNAADIARLHVTRRTRRRRNRPLIIRKLGKSREQRLQVSNVSSEIARRD